MTHLRDFAILEWDADHLPPPGEIDAIAVTVFDHLEAEIDHPRQCVFATLSLTVDDAGPSVFVTGDKARDVFHCRYSAVTEWDV